MRISVNRRASDRIAAAALPPAPHPTRAAWRRLSSVAQDAQVGCEAADRGVCAPAVVGPDSGPDPARGRLGAPAGRHRPLRAVASVGALLFRRRADVPGRLT